jgi:hypothetical protein
VRRKRPPDAAPGAPPLTCSRPPVGPGAGAGGDQLLSHKPLYSGSISGGAAYARCQSSASRSGGPGTEDGLAASGIGEATRATGLAGPGRRSAGRAGGRTDGLAETDGRAGGRRGAREAGPGRSGSLGGGGGGSGSGSGSGGCGGAGGAERGRPLPGTPQPGRVRRAGLEPPRHRFS